MNYVLSFSYVAWPPTNNSYCYDDNKTIFWMEIIFTT